MHIEDIIIAISGAFMMSLNQWDNNLVHSFANQIFNGTALTEKQGLLAVKIIKKHAAQVSKIIGKDVTPYIANPTFKFPLRTISNAKKVSIIDHSLFHKAIKLEFPYNEESVNRIRKARDQIDYAAWDKDEKSWIFALTEPNISFIVDFISIENFSIDPEFEIYIKECKKIMNEMEQHVPMLVLEDKKPKFKNIGKNVPNLTTDNILGAVFEARKKGIFTWSDEISEILSNGSIDECTLKFLTTEPQQAFHVDLEKYEIFQLGNIIKHLTPCLFVIPGGSELEKLELAYNFLKSIDIKNQEMAVMFRLPSISHKNFNEFVKNNELNSPIDDNTKVIFISGKLPKPVLKSKIKFNSIVNLGFGGVHYSMRDFIAKHENLIFYTEKLKQKEFDFVYL